MLRPEWLAKTPETTLEPELPIIDPHHHLWDMDPETYGRYLTDDLVADLTSGHNVVGTVFVECMTMYRDEGPEALRPVGETEYVEAVAQQFASERDERPGYCCGIVGHADLFLGDAVAETLEAHLDASPRFRGIRHATAWDSYEGALHGEAMTRPGMLLDAHFQEGFARLGPLGLSFDAWMYHPQIPELASLARRFPETSIVLDHVGGPLGIGPYASRREAVKAEWKRNLRELATCPNVSVKLGGLVMDVSGFGFSERDAPPSSADLARETGDYHLHAIDCFGPDRCMFESNFPVDKQSCSYTVLWNTFKRITDGFSAAERAALFSDTASRFYRLDANVA
jgi:predicted TIM-barrel fold metal-dependent hydrolase